MKGWLHGRRAALTSSSWTAFSTILYSMVTQKRRKVAGADRREHPRRMETRKSAWVSYPPLIEPGPFTPAESFLPNGRESRLLVSVTSGRHGFAGRSNER